MTGPEPRAGLWRHQREAVEKICAELGSGTSVTDRRATAIAACGTGKTLIGAESSRRLAPAGRVLVFVPTLELLAQTAHAYAGHLGAAAGVIAAVCGDHKATESAARLRGEITDLHAPVTTDPGELAALARHDGRLTVFATYASLPAVRTAHADHRCPPWDLVIADEAHRTAGIAGQWTQVHDNRLLPAHRRLYLTATPRIMTSGGSDIVSMDDPAVFGRQVFQLPFAAAIDAGLLADYRVAVVTVTDAEVAKLTAPHRMVSVGGRAVDARTLAMQIALAKAIRDYRLRRVITYHGRVASATRFAAGLRTALELLPPRDRPAWPVHARWVSGAMSGDARREALSALHNPGRSTVAVANAKVLAEGVDVPALDAVMFADPRSSATDVVQAVGRALRRGPGSDKIATVIVPIFLSEDENPQAALHGSEFDTVWRVVRALRAHDERIADYLDQRRQRRGREDRDPDPGRWLSVDGVPAQIGDEFHRSILVRTVETTTSSWWEIFGALECFHTEYGHLDVPGLYRTPSGVGLRSWLAGCRRLYRAGALPAERVRALETLGIDWRARRGWERGIAELHRYRREHGTAEVPHDYATADGYLLGNWLGNQRRRHRDGLLTDSEAGELRALGIDPANRRRRDPKHEANWSENLAAAQEFRDEYGHLEIPGSYRTPDGRGLGGWLQHCREYREAGILRPERIAQLDQLGIDWRPYWSQWQRAVDALRTYRDEYGHVDVKQTYVTAGGFRLGAWLGAQRAAYLDGRLAPDRRRRLDALGVDWRPSESWWYVGLAAFTAYRHTHGDRPVPQRYVTDDGFPLGGWVATRRKDYGNGKLTPEQIAALDAVGMPWDPHGSRWESAVAALIAYRHAYGHVRVPQKYTTADGFHLGSWMNTRRRQHLEGRLSAERSKQLAELGVDLTPRRERRPESERPPHTVVAHHATSTQQYSPRDIERRPAEPSDFARRPSRIRDSAKHRD